VQLKALEDLMDAKRVSELEAQKESMVEDWQSEVLYVQTKYEDQSREHIEMIAALKVRITYLENELAILEWLDPNPVNLSVTLMKQAYWRVSGAALHDACRCRHRGPASSNR